MAFKKLISDLGTLVKLSKLSQLNTRRYFRMIYSYYFVNMRFSKPCSSVTFVTFSPDRVALDSLKPYSQERCQGLKVKVHDRAAQPNFVYH